MIEKGPHFKRKLEREDRKCPYCIQCIEHECHFITECPLYNNNRKGLLAEVTNDSIHFNIMRIKEKVGLHYEY